MGSRQPHHLRLGGFRPMTNTATTTLVDTPLTRTRLRPGGPSSSSSEQSRYFGTTTKSLRNGSLPSVNGFISPTNERGGGGGGVGEDEMIQMHTFGGNKRHNNHNVSALPVGGGKEPLFPVSSAFYGTLNKPATPLVKQRTAGCVSPRVQMYRTRVIYSDLHRDPEVNSVLGDLGSNGQQEAAVWN